MSEVETELEELVTRPDGPFVAKLTREPGRRESRYMHLFSGEAPPFVEDEARPSRATPVRRRAHRPPRNASQLSRLQSPTCGGSSTCSRAGSEPLAESSGSPTPLMRALLRNRHFLLFVAIVAVAVGVLVAETGPSAMRSARC